MSETEKKFNVMAWIKKVEAQKLDEEKSTLFTLGDLTTSAQNTLKAIRESIAFDEKNKLL